MTTARRALPLLFFFLSLFPLLLLNAGVVGANPLLDHLQPNPQRRTLIASVCFQRARRGLEILGRRSVAAFKETAVAEAGLL